MPGDRPDPEIRRLAAHSDPVPAPGARLDPVPAPGDRLDPVPRLATDSDPEHHRDVDPSPAVARRQIRPRITTADMLEPRAADRR